MELPMNNHKIFMSEAIKLAVENVQNSQGGPFGALVVLNDSVIAQGVNMVTASHDPTAHAEVVAIRAACSRLNSFQLSGCILYTSCEPCPMCLGAIYWARLAKVYYSCTRYHAAAVGFDDSLIYQQIAVAPEKRIVYFEQLMRDDALEAFDVWSTSSQKKVY